ncbi:MAG: hypothetical protein U0414_27870 [Polyangiaceae bacterium]
MLQLQLSNGQIVAIAITAAAIIALYVLGRSGPTQQIRTLANFGCVGVLVGGLGYWAGKIAPTIEGGVAFLKVCLALAAMSAVYFEARRAQERRPIAERWKKFVGVTLGVAAIVVYFNGFKVGYQKFWHRHDQYHYYFGAKYFRELGYDKLYKCTVVALDELGTVEADVPTRDANGNITTKKVPFNFSAEVQPGQRAAREHEGQRGRARQEDPEPRRRQPPLPRVRGARAQRGVQPARQGRGREDRRDVLVRALGAVQERHQVLPRPDA